MRSRKFSHLLIGLSLCLSLVLPFSASAIGIEPTLPDPVKEQRARELFKELRCMVCQNQSIDDSNADLARDLRVVVRERIAAGDSDEQAKEYLVERYGDWVLLNPPVKAETALLWSSPFILLGIAFSVGFFYLRRAKNAPEVEQSLAAEEKQELRKLMADWQKNPKEPNP